MKAIFALYFERSYEHRDDTELWIGVYATDNDARAAADELKLKPGFREFPEGFQIYEWEIGRTGWKDSSQNSSRP